MFLDFQERLSRVAKVERPVLIVGERGTGKELAANRVHYLSQRWQRPVVALNCAALTPSLIESELFGHEAGAFTGAAGQRQGRFESADGGSLFLDEIGLIPVEVQEKILRVVEYQMFERVGGSEQVQVDVRIIAATNADLPGLAQKGEFKQDLLDRLSFEVLFLPPLRERHEDIILLARHFAARMAQELGYEKAPTFSREAIRALESYGWPGNVRELKNVVERAVYKAEEDVLETIEFDPFQSPYAVSGIGPAADDNAVDTSHEASPAAAIRQPLPEAVRTLEVRALQDALKRARYRQAEAARLLGLTYHQFRRLYRKYKSEVEGKKEEGTNS